MMPWWAWLISWVTISPIVSLATAAFLHRATRHYPIGDWTQAE